MITQLLKSANKKLLSKNYLFDPEWIVLGVNNVCNLHCKMCDVGTKNLESNFAQNLVGTHPLNMPLDLIKKIIDQIAKYYPKTKLGYAFTEPLVFPNLIESIKYASSKNIKTSITTNALTLKQIAKELVDAGLENLFISLDGPKDIHNEIRGHKKSFQKAEEGILEILKHNPKQKISIFCVITEWNIGYLEEFTNYFKKFPLQQIGFMHTNFTPQKIADSHNNLYHNSYRATASNIDEINIDNYDLNILADEIKQIKNEYFPFPITFSPELNTKEDIEMFYLKPEKIIGKRCDDVFSNIMIKSDGSAIPSHGRCYNLELGNIYNNNLKEIWQSNILKKLRTDLNKAGGLFPACSRCCSAF